MRRLHTHYDNLKVARDAPTEVIKAAYRALAQRYHPDVNPSPEAARVMRVLNEAWAVLGDPAARRRHDEWIESQLVDEAIAEALAAQGQQHSTSTQAAAETSTLREGVHPPASPTPVNPLINLNDWLGTPTGRRFALGTIAAAGLLVWLWITSSPPTSIASSPSPRGSEQVAHRTPQSSLGDLAPPASIEMPIPPRLALDRWSPNGKAWPTTAAYVDGMPRRASGGLSKLTIDNTNGGTDVHIKLCSFAVERCTGLRNVFVPQGSSFTMANIAPGAYDLRYRDLASGQIAKSEEIKLKQIDDGDSTRFSVVRITLYKVQGGNTNFTTVPEDQF